MLVLGSPSPLPSRLLYFYYWMCIFRVFVGSLFVTSCGRALPSLPPGLASFSLGNRLFKKALFAVLFSYVLFFSCLGSLIYVVRFVLPLCCGLPFRYVLGLVVF